MANTKINYKSIISYYGGKTASGYMIKLRGVIKEAKKQNNATTMYDLFGGAAHVALNLEDEFDKVIYNEYSQCIYEFFHVLKDGTKRSEFIDLLSKIEPCKDNFEIARTILDNEERMDELGLTDIQKACIAFIVTSWSYNSNMEKFGNIKVEKEFSKGSVPKSIKDLETAGKMLRNIEVNQGDYWEIMKDHLEDEDAVFILDPPYVKETRYAGTADAYARDEFDHIKFLDRCNQCKVPIIICGYDTELYDKELVQKGWKRISMGEYTVSNNKGVENKKEEIIWTNNFDAPDKV